MNILFRADGNEEIGAGHIMRCLSIANAGYSLGNKCLFITASDHFSNVIHRYGHKNIVLNTDYKAMYSELTDMEKLIFKYNPSVLFLDSYYVSFEYMNTLQKFCEKVKCKLVYIDDILSFPYPCDILLNYNIYGLDKEDEYKCLYERKGVPFPQFLLGTKYVPLRSEFQHLLRRTVKKKVKNILISTGGSDPDHIARKLAGYIIRNTKYYQNYCFHFVIGTMNNDREEMEKLAVTNKSVIIHYNVQQMQKLMSAMDLAISAAGSTLYELCATQTPAITYILADNQILGAEGFSSRGLLHCVGDMRRAKDLSKVLLDEAIKLAENYEKRVKIAEQQRALIDGNGAQRIIEGLFEV